MDSKDQGDRTETEAPQPGDSVKLPGTGEDSVVYDGRRKYPLYPRVPQYLYELVEQEAERTGFSASYLIFLVLDVFFDVKTAYPNLGLVEIARSLYESHPKARGSTTVLPSGDKVVRPQQKEDSDVKDDSH